jgi:hypothetical protein
LPYLHNFKLIRVLSVPQGYSGGAAAAGGVSPRVRPSADREELKAFFDPFIAGALQPWYAPELNMIGVAQGGSSADISGTARFIVSLFIWYLAGMGSAYLFFETRIQKLLSPQGRGEIFKVRTRCATDNIFVYTNQEVVEMYVTIGAAALDDLIIKMSRAMPASHR